MKKGLVTPSNYTYNSNEEMGYVDGSWSFLKTLAVITTSTATVSATNISGSAIATGLVG